MAYSNYNDNKGFPYSNLNKALTPMLLLSALELQPMYINEIVTMLEKESNGVYKTSYPYDIVYQLTENDYIIPTKKIQKDGRRRQLYMLSDKGKKYLDLLLADYKRYISGIEMLTNYIDTNKNNAEDK